MKKHIDDLGSMARSLKRMSVILTVLLVVYASLLAISFIVNVGKNESTDQRMLRLQDSHLDLEARLAKVEQENMTLFRMLRAETPNYGIIPAPVPPTRVQPLPPVPPGRRTGDSPIGDSAFGDSEE